jgi:hypothetical protein
MQFRWVAGIALWTILSGPAMYGTGPAPAAKQTVSPPQKQVKSEANVKAPSRRS